MSDFGFNLDFRVSGEAELQRLIDEYESLGVRLEKVVGVQKQHEDGLEQIAKLTGKITAEQAELIRQSEKFHEVETKFTIKEIRNLKQKVALVQELKAVTKDTYMSGQYTNIRSNVLNEEYHIRQAIAAQQKAQQEAEKQAELDRKAKEAEITRQLKMQIAAKFEQHALDMQQEFEREKVLNEELKIRAAIEKENKEGKNQFYDFLGGKGHIHDSLSSVITAFNTSFLVGEQVLGVVERINHGIFEMTEHSMEFNDELRRAGVIFTSLGVLSTGKNISSIEAGGYAGADKDQAKLAIAKSFSKELTGKLRAEAAAAGQDFSEVLAATKTFLPNVINKSGDPDFLLHHAKDGKVIQLTKDFVDLISVMKMLDPNGRNLSFHAFSIEKAFDGTNGGKAGSSGAMNFRSLLMRERINLTKDEMSRITGDISKHNVFKAMEDLKAALQRSGISTNKLKDLLTKTLTPNIEGIKSSFKVIFGQFTSPAYDKLLLFFRSFNVFLSQVSTYKPFMDALQNLGEQIAGHFSVAIQNVKDFFNMLGSPDGIKGMQELGQAMSAVVDIYINFFSGLFGKNIGDAKTFSETMKELREDVEALRGPAYALGELFRGIANALLHIKTILTGGIVGGLIGAAIGGYSAFAKATAADSPLLETPLAPYALAANVLAGVGGAAWTGFGVGSAVTAVAQPMIHSGLAHIYNNITVNNPVIQSNNPIEFAHSLQGFAGAMNYEMGKAQNAGVGGGH